MRSRIEKGYEKEGKSARERQGSVVNLCGLKEKHRLGRLYKRLRSGELAQGQECRAQRRTMTVTGATFQCRSLKNLDSKQRSTLQPQTRCSQSATAAPVSVAMRSSGQRAASRTCLSKLPCRPQPPARPKRRSCREGRRAGQACARPTRETPTLGRAPKQPIRAPQRSLSSSQKRCAATPMP